MKYLAPALALLALSPLSVRTTNAGGRGTFSIVVVPGSLDDDESDDDDDDSVAAARALDEGAARASGAVTLPLVVVDAAQSSPISSGERSSSRCSR